MNLKFKSLALPIAALAVISLSFSSCEKTTMNHDTYFYLSKPIKEASSTLIVDGMNMGAVNFVAPPITDKSKGMNYIKLKGGRHTIQVNDNNNHGIISGYIDLYDDGVGSGSWGTAGGGMECNGDISKHIELVGMFE